MKILELRKKLIKWLHEKSFITVFAFHPPENLNEIQHLDGFIKEYSKGEIKINTMSEEWYSLELGNHMISYAHLFDDFYLIADDPVYELPLLSVLPKEFTIHHAEDIGKYQIVDRMEHANTAHHGGALFYTNRYKESI